MPMVSFVALQHFWLTFLYLILKKHLIGLYRNFSNLKLSYGTHMFKFAKIAIKVHKVLLSCLVLSCPVFCSIVFLFFHVLSHLFLSCNLLSCLIVSCISCLVLTLVVDKTKHAYIWKSDCLIISELACTAGTSGYQLLDPWLQFCMFFFPKV